MCRLDLGLIALRVVGLLLFVTVWLCCFVVGVGVCGLFSVMNQVIYCNNVSLVFGFCIITWWFVAC